MPFSIKLPLVSVHGLTHYKVSQTTFGDLLFLLHFLLSLLLLLLLLLFSFLSLAHERVHGRSRELLDRIS